MCFWCRRVRRKWLVCWAHVFPLFHLFRRRQMHAVNDSGRRWTTCNRIILNAMPMHFCQGKKKKKNTVNFTETCSRWRSFATHHERGSHHDVTYKRIQCGCICFRALFSDGHRRLLMTGQRGFLTSGETLYMAFVFVESTLDCVRNAHSWQRIWIFFEILKSSCSFCDAQRNTFLWARKKKSNFVERWHLVLGFTRETNMVGMKDDVNEIATKFHYEKKKKKTIDFTCHEIPSACFGQWTSWFVRKKILSNVLRLQLRLRKLQNKTLLQSL